MSETREHRSGAHPWRERARPLRLERRVEFDDYETLRDFLDGVAALSEETGLHPNISFGRTYANLTLFAEDREQAIGEQLRSFARRIDALLETP